MQIVEVKNNLVKVSYDTSEETLILSGFVAIKDTMQSFIGQIIHLEANSKGNFAIVKLFFNFNDEGVITNYDGSIPDTKSLVDTVHPQELLELFSIQSPILLGELAQQKTLLKLDKNIFEKKLLVCSEKAEDNEILTSNFAQQLLAANNKVLVIDLGGNLDFSSEKIVAGKDFKLPLNYETINFIYEKGLDDAKAETRAMIQEIFLEVQNYVKTLPEQFIPFETFKNVVDSQYEELEIVELVLLKNKLLKYYEAGVFAQNNKEFETLNTSLDSENITILDLSKIDENIQREMISYVYCLIKKLGRQLDKEFYIILNINDSNSDKKLLKQIFMTKNAYSTIICPYSYKYLKELKQISKDLILFAPIQQQNDFASYSTFLNKLNSREFVVYGQATHHLPLIVKLDELSKFVGHENESQIASQQDLLDEEIKRDVDRIYTAPTVSQSEYTTELVEDLTEEDLDFIDDFGAVARENAEIEDIQTEVEPENTLVLEEVNNSLLELEPENEITNNEESEILSYSNLIDETSEPAEQIQENIEIVENVEEPVEAFSEVLNQQAQEELESAPMAPPAVDILPANMSTTPIVPIYSADIEPQVSSYEIEQGDIVIHPKYGKGTVEKLINYGSKTLCSINFDNVGRRLLDPTLAEIKKVT